MAWNSNIGPHFGRYLQAGWSDWADSICIVPGVLRHKFRVPTTYNSANFEITVFGGHNIRYLLYKFEHILEIWHTLIDLYISKTTEMFWIQFTLILFPQDILYRICFLGTYFDTWHYQTFLCPPQGRVEVPIQIARILPLLILSLILIIAPEKSTNQTSTMSSNCMSHKMDITASTLHVFLFTNICNWIILQLYMRCK